MIDEESFSDTDYISSATAGSIFEVLLTDLADPGTSTGHVLRYRVSSLYGNGITFKLVQNTTVLDTWTESSLTTDWEARSHSFSGTVIDSITDYRNIRVRGEAVA
jgi:hypothetical protein